MTISRVDRHGARDRDQMLVGDAEVAQPRVGVDMAGMHRVEHLARIGAHGLPVDGAEARARRMAEKDVLGDRQIVEQHGFLMDRGDAVLEGLVRAGERDRLAADADLAGVRLVDAGEDLHQRRLAGAVLADQRGHLARIERQADIVQRAHAREGSCDTPESVKQRRAVAGGGVLDSAARAVVSMIRIRLCRALVERARREQSPPRSSSIAPRSVDLGELFDVGLVELEGRSHRSRVGVVERDLADAADRDLGAGLGLGLLGRELVGDLDGRVAEVDRVPERDGLRSAVVDELLELGRQRKAGDVDLADQALVGDDLRGGDDADGGRRDDRLEVRIGWRSGPWLRWCTSPSRHRRRRWRRG